MGIIHYVCILNNVHRCKNLANDTGDSMITVITGHINEKEITEIEELKAQTEDMKDCKIIIFPESGKHPKDVFRTAIKLALDDDEEKDNTIIITFSALIIEAIDVVCEKVLKKEPDFYLKDDDGFNWIDSMNYLYRIYDNLYKGGYDECDRMNIRESLPIEFRKEYPEENCC